MNRVAQVGNLLCRRLPVGDTADCQSALHRRGSWPMSSSKQELETPDEPPLLPNKEGSRGRSPHLAGIYHAVVELVGDQDIARPVEAPVESMGFSGAGLKENPGPAKGSRRKAFYWAPTSLRHP